jgi:hypothetical protein
MKVKSLIQAEFVNLFRRPGIDSQLGGLVRQPYLMHLPARIYRLAESIPEYRCIRIDSCAEFLP